MNSIFCENTMDVTALTRVIELSKVLSSFQFQHISGNDVIMNMFLHAHTQYQ